MKRMMLFAGAFALLLGSGAASAAEEGWEVYRKARPNPLRNSPAVAKILAPFGQVPELPIEPAPNVLRDKVNITLEPGTYENLYIKGTDIVLVTGDESSGLNWIYVTGEGNVIEPGAIVLYDDWVFSRNGGHSLQFGVRNGNLMVGSPGGELVNFSGVGVRWNKSGIIQTIGSYALLNAGNTELHEAVFVNHETALSTVAKAWDTNLSGESVYIIRAGEGLTVYEGLASNAGKASVRLVNPYFSGNLYSVYVDEPHTLFTPEYEPRFSCELVNAYFGPRQSPLAAWDSSDVREGYSKVFTISEPAPTALGQVDSVQTWPREVLFADADFTRNGRINADDFAVMAQSFGDSAKAILFGWRYDLDINGKIGLPDVGLFAYAFAGVSRSEPMSALAASPALPGFLATIVQYPAIRDAAQAEALADPNGFGAMVQSYLQRTAVLEVRGEVPSAFSLGQNYPNPFNSGTVIRFQLPQEANVKLAVYNTLGQVVARLVDERLPAGSYTTMWDGLGADGRPAGSGTYLYRIRAGAYEQVNKMTLLR